MAPPEHAKHIDKQAHYSFINPAIHLNASVKHLIHCNVVTHFTYRPTFNNYQFWGEGTTDQGKSKPTFSRW